MDSMLALPQRPGFDSWRSKEFLMLLRFIDGTALYSEQSFDNVIWTHLVLASGKQVLQKEAVVNMELSLLLLGLKRAVPHVKAFGSWT